MANFQFNETIIEKGLELLESGATKAKVEAYGLLVHDMSTNEAKEFASLVFEKAGLSTNTYSADWESTVRYLREHFGKLPKKELIEGMCRVNGKTYKSNQHAYNYIRMAIEWAKQEVEAQQ